MQKQEIPFSEVKPGERFTSLKTKRAFVGVKIQDTPNTFQAHVSLNAVMVTYDHQTELGPESGTLIYVEPEEVVEVCRQKESELIKEGGYRFLKIHLNDEYFNKFVEMMGLSGLRLPGELVNNALTLLGWAQQKVLEGKVIAAVDESTHQYKEVIIPALENIAAMRESMEGEQ